MKRNKENSELEAKKQLVDLMEDIYALYKENIKSLEELDDKIRSYLESLKEWSKTIEFFASSDKMNFHTFEHCYFFDRIISAYEFDTDSFRILKSLWFNERKKYNAGPKESIKKLYNEYTKLRETLSHGTVFECKQLFWDKHKQVKTVDICVLFIEEFHEYLGSIMASLNEYSGRPYEESFFGIKFGHLTPWRAKKEYERIKSTKACKSAMAEFEERGYCVPLDELTALGKKIYDQCT